MNIHKYIEKLVSYFNVNSTEFQIQNTFSKLLENQLSIT